MITNCKFLVLIALLARMGIPVLGQGVVVIQHSGATGPVTEEWRGIGGSPVTNDFGINAWSTSQYVHYEYSLTSQQQAGLANGWVFSVKTRVTTPDANPNYFNAVLMSAAYGNVALWFGSMANGDPLVNLNYGPGLSTTNTFVLAGAGSSYNLYQLIYDGSADMLSFWINGAEYANNVPLLPDISNVIWEGGGNPQFEQVNWNLVSLEIVPEPSAVALLFLGSGAVICLRFRRRAGKIQCIRVTNPG